MTNISLAIVSQGGSHILKFGKSFWITLDQNIYLEGKNIYRGLPSYYHPLNLSPFSLQIGPGKKGNIKLESRFASYHCPTDVSVSHIGYTVVAN
jgi:hypothetical protein